MKNLQSILIILFLMAPIQAQVLYENQKIFPADNTEKDHFGWSVSMDENFLVAGAPYDNNHSGAVYIYKKTDNGWVQDKKITPASSDNTPVVYGYSVSIRGDYLVVGCINAPNTSGTMTGAVYLYHYNGSTWEEETVLYPEDGWEGLFFGNHVSMGNMTVAVAGTDERSGNAVDPVYLFTKQNDEWIQIRKILTTGAMDLRGISLGDTTLAIGYSYDNEVSGGAVYVYYSHGGTWDNSVRIVPEKGDYYGFFGQSVCLYHDSLLMVGAFGSNDPNNHNHSAYIYCLNNGTWESDTMILPLDTISYDVGWYGNAVAINDQYALIGAVDDNFSGDRIGSAYVYKHTEEGSWDFINLLQPSANPMIADNSSQFGRSVSLYDTSYVVGAPFMSNDSWFVTGAAFLYHTTTPVTFVDPSPGQEDGAPVIFPNPVSDHLTLHFVNAERRAITLSDLKGRIVYSIRSDHTTAEINTTSLHPGIYFLCIRTEKEKFVKKIIKH